MASDVSLPYYNNPRPDVMAFVPHGTGKLLDVGCANGSFGVALKQRDSRNVTGIEIVPEAAAQARELLDEVLEGDAVDLMASLPSGSFEVVSFNDVLEHLIWPGDALIQSRRLLEPGGKLVVCLPNLRFWEPFKRLVFHSEFEYVASGIMDRTHLRFFTRASGHAMIEACGFRVLESAELHPIKSRLLRVVDVFAQNRFKDCLPLQHVYVAEVGSEPRPHPLRERF